MGKSENCIYYAYTDTPRVTIYTFINLVILRYIFTELQTEASKLVLQCMHID